VDPNGWYIEFIDYVIANGIMQGTNTNPLTFEPNTKLSRAMMVQILYNMEGRPAVGGGEIFDDVPAGSWYFDAVAWSYLNDMVFGYGDGKFGPGDSVTRGQMGAILYRYAEYKGYDTSVSADLGAFADAGDISEWAIDAMKWAVGSGLIVGRGEGNIAPKDTATRAEMATIITRFCKTVVGTEMPAAETEEDKLMPEDDEEDGGEAGDDEEEGEEAAAAE
jgi:hypothetical protein